MPLMTNLKTHFRSCNTYSRAYQMPLIAAILMLAASCATESDNGEALLEQGQDEQRDWPLLEQEGMNRPFHLIGDVSLRYSAEREEDEAYDFVWTTLQARHFDGSPATIIRMSLRALFNDGTASEWKTKIPDDSYVSHDSDIYISYQTYNKRVEAVDLVVSSEAGRSRSRLQLPPRITNAALARDYRTLRMTWDPVESISHLMAFQEVTFGTESFYNWTHDYRITAEDGQEAFKLFVGYVGEDADGAGHPVTPDLVTLERVSLYDAHANAQRDSRAPAPGFFGKNMFSEQANDAPSHGATYALRSSVSLDVPAGELAPPSLPQDASY